MTPIARTQFAIFSRILHWLMAVMLLTMLFIGVTMVASLGDYHRLVAIHRPLGIVILILAIVRLINRMFTTLPPFPATMSAKERLIATASERLFYTLMIVLPLVGWAMLSAARYPVVMFGPIHLPPILPASPALYAVLRKSHTILAYLLFVTFLAHLSAVLFHTFIIRDRLLSRMAIWPTRSGEAKRSGDNLAQRAACDAAVNANHKQSTNENKERNGIHENCKYESSGPEAV